MLRLTWIGKTIQLSFYDNYVLYAPLKLEIKGKYKKKNIEPTFFSYKHFVSPTRDKSPRAECKVTARIMFSNTDLYCWHKIKLSKGNISGINETKSMD